MIRKNTLECKLFNLKISKISGFDIYADVLRHISLHDEVCPTCGLKGGCSFFGTYERYLIDFQDGMPCSRQLKITRVICECGHTHAILPDPIIPYLQYSLFYILLVLAIYSCHLLSIDRICEMFSITPTLLYRWKSIYEDHRSEWQGLLLSTSQDVRHSLYELSRKDGYGTFATSFISKTSFSLLQSHANPANCQRNLQYIFSPEAFNTT